jgi:hypothetical protein
VVVGDGEESGSFEAWPAHGERMGRSGDRGKSSLQRDRQFFALFVVLAWLTLITLL